VTDDQIVRLANAVYQALNPDPLDAVAEAVSAAFADAAERDGGRQRHHLALADTLAAHRAWQARSAAKYGPLEAMLAPGGRGGLSARIWC
jgi:hypothetical protein